MTDLSKTVPVARDQLANGLYQVISNGVPENNWIEYLQASARASVGGIADLGEVVKVTSTVIKNYGLQWQDAEGIQDKIQLTAKNGVTTFEQLAQALPRVTGSAAALGVSVDELMASFATLTGVSGNTAEVATQMQAIFTALVKPSAEASKMAQQMGIQFDAAAVKAAGGLQNFLTSLQQSVRQYSASSGVLEQEVYGRLFGSAEALRALIPLNGKALSGDIELKARDIKVTVGGAEVTLQANNDRMGESFTALNNKVNGLGTKGAANGLASLDGSGKVPSSQLPSYVDDVVEFNSIPISNPGDAFEDGDAPEGSTIVFVKDTGCFIAQNDSSIYSSWSGCESFGTKTENGVKPDGGKIYVTTQNNKTWRWSGSAMVEISASLALGETSATAYAGDKGKANRDALNALPGTVATGFTVSPDKTAVSFNLQLRKKGSNNQYGSSDVIDTKTIPAATASAAGVMAAGDKSKLDGIATGATADSALTTSEIDALLV